MKVIRAIGTAIVLAVLCAALMLTLVAGPVRFLALNPWYLKTFVPTRSYCEQLRENLTEDLDHVALLYGLEAGIAVGIHVFVVVIIELGIGVKIGAVPNARSAEGDIRHEQRKGDEQQEPFRPQPGAGETKYHVLHLRFVC